MKPTSRSLQPPSPLFLEVLFSPQDLATTAECELCARVHYDTTNDEARARFEHKRDQEPSAYFAHDGPVNRGMLNGEQVVRGCPCNRLAAFESFIWDSRGLFMAFIEARAKALADEATHELAPVAGARQALQTLPA